MLIPGEGISVLSHLERGWNITLMGVVNAALNTDCEHSSPAGRERK
jgi:hypothetical protein